jgi:hypothetical protein
MHDNNWQKFFYRYRKKRIMTFFCYEIPVILILLELCLTLIIAPLCSNLTIHVEKNGGVYSDWGSSHETIFKSPGPEVPALWDSGDTVVEEVTTDEKELSSRVVHLSHKYRW